MSNVIVVPQQDQFKSDIHLGQVIYINHKLGEPQLLDRKANYVVPFFLADNSTPRIFEILDMLLVGQSYEIYLGNSYRVSSKWNNMSQRRVFEYHPLSSFGYNEMSPGYLLPI